MLTELLKDCKTDEEKAQRKTEFVAAEPALKRLRVLLRERKERALNDLARNQNYENAAWPYLQADRVASLRIYNDLLELLTLTKGNE